MSRGRTEAAVIRVIAETFGCDPAGVNRTTTADDVDGWDSLSHTVLMVRLGRALGLSIPESATEFGDVGELIDALDALPR